MGTLRAVPVRPFVCLSVCLRLILPSSSVRVRYEKLSYRSENRASAAYILLHHAAKNLAFVFGFFTRYVRG